jgi:hypothetical protein
VVAHGRAKARAGAPKNVMLDKKAEFKLRTQMNDITLIVIDMQTSFNASKNVLDECLGLVKTFVKANAPVIFVEFVGCGRTHTKLRRAAQNAHYVVKSQMNGSQDIVSHVIKHNLPNKYVMCGVYTGECVLETASGLSTQHTSHHVYAPACADYMKYSIVNLVQDLTNRKKKINVIDNLITLKKVLCLH